MTVFHHTLHIRTNKQFQLFAITRQIEQALEKSNIDTGICTVFVPHTTAGLRINDNEALLHQDIMKALYRLAPIDVSYAHDNFESRQKIKPEERSNGHAHVKSFFLGSSESIPVAGQKLLLGNQQEIFLIEFDGPRERTVNVTILGNV